MRAFLTALKGLPVGTRINPPNGLVLLPRQSKLTWQISSFTRVCGIPPKYVIGVDERRHNGITVIAG